MKKLLKYMKGFGKECVLGPLFKLLEATFELFIPLVVASIVDDGILRGDNGHIVKMCAVMIALGIIGLVCAVTAQYFAAKAAVGFSTRLPGCGNTPVRKSKPAVPPVLLCPEAVPVCGRCPVKPQQKKPEIRWGCRSAAAGYPYLRYRWT